MSKNSCAPYKKYQCRYFDEHGKPLKTPCNQGDNCRFVHPNDPNWPGLKCHPVLPGYSSSNRRSSYGKNDRTGRDRSRRSRSPNPRAGLPLVPQDDLFRRCKQEEGDGVLPSSDRSYNAQKVLNKVSVEHQDRNYDQIDDARNHSPQNLKESNRALSHHRDSISSSYKYPDKHDLFKDPRRRSSPGRQPDENAGQDVPKLPERSFLGASRVGPSPRSEKLVDVFRKITLFSSQIVQDTLTFNQEERKLQTYNDISTTLSRISESAASAVAPPLAEIILTRAQSKERLEEGYHALAGAWDQVFDIFVSEVAQTIEEKLESALCTIKDEAKYLTDGLAASDSKGSLKRKSGDYMSDEGSSRPKGHLYNADLGRAKHGDPSNAREEKRRKITASGSFSPGGSRDDINDLSSLEEILQRMKSKIDQQSNSLQTLARENQELKGQLQTNGSRAATSESSIPRAPKEMLNAQRDVRYNSGPSETESFEKSRPTYPRDRENDRYTGHRDSRSRDGYYMKRRD